MATNGKPGMQLPKVTINSPVVLWFVIVCVAVQVVSTLTGGASTDALFTFHTSSLSSPLEFFRLVTFAFGHISWDHLIGNMSYILLLGPLLEEKYGSPRLVAVILTSALTCSIASIVIFHTGGVGASGVVFTFLILSSVTRVREGEIPLTFILVGTFYLCQQLYGAIFVRAFVSYHGHIIGGLTGAALGFLLPEKSSADSRGIF